MRRNNHGDAVEPLGRRSQIQTEIAWAQLELEDLQAVLTRHVTHKRWWMYQTLGSREQQRSNQRTKPCTSIPAASASTGPLIWTVIWRGSTAAAGDLRWRWRAWGSCSDARRARYYGPSEQLHQVICTEHRTYACKEKRQND